MKKEKKIESKTKRSLPGYGTATYPDSKGLVNPIKNPKLITIEAPEGALVVPKDMILQWAVKVITDELKEGNESTERIYTFEKWTDVTHNEIIHKTITQLTTSELNCLLGNLLNTYDKNPIRNQNRFLRILLNRIKSNKQ